jgi:hypothetical protein
MEFPEREVALVWVGKTLVDRDGVEIGACTAVFTDDATRLTEWVCSEVEGTAVFIPAVGATESGGAVQVAVSRDDVANAPTVGGAEHISGDEEAALYRHYGIPHSREASSGLLPTGEPQPVMEEVTSGAEEDLAEPASTLPQLGLAEPAATPAAAEPDGGSSAERALPVAVALAGVGIAVGVVLRVRRIRRRRPPTRTERILARGRAAAGAVSSGADRITASAAPLLETTRRVVPLRGRAVAVAGALPVAAAIMVPILRRRRSGADPGAGRQED